MKVNKMKIVKIKVQSFFCGSTECRKDLLINIVDKNGDVHVYNLDENNEWIDKSFFEDKVNETK